MSENKNRKVATFKLDKGIVRNEPFGNVGELEDCINAVKKNGALRPIQRGYQFAPPSSYDLITRHKTISFDHYIGYRDSDRKIEHYNVQTLAVTQLILTLEEGELINDIEVLKNYLLIATTSEFYKFLFIKDSYVKINVSTPPRFLLFPTDHKVIVTERTTSNHDMDSIVTSVFEKINNESKDGFLAGAISCRAAYKLFDGSYLLITTPLLIIPGGTVSIPMKLHDDSWNIDKNLDAFEGWIAVDETIEDGGKVVKFLVNKWSIEFSATDYADMQNEKNIISSICVFFSKPLQKYNIEETIKLGWIGNITINDGEVLFDAENVLSDDYSALTEPEAGWFLAAEIPFDKIIDNDDIFLTVDTDNDLKTKNWYQNYASHKLLPLDDGTHHTVRCNRLFKYNSRLWITGLTKEMVSTPVATNAFRTREREALGYTTMLQVKIIAKLTVDNRLMYVESDDANLAFKNDGTKHEVLLPAITYPDARCEGFIVYVNFAGNWRELLNVIATQSENYNYSYYFNIESSTPFESTPLCYTGSAPLCRLYFRVEEVLAELPLVTEFPSSNTDDYSYSAQIQASKLNNPLIYPASLNYTVGTGEILDFATSSDPLSEGQFGQFPVHVFTSEGIYTLTLGTADVLITTVNPLASDVLIGRALSTSKGIFYCTREGIMVLIGREPICVSKPLESDLSDVISHAQFNLYSNHIQIVELGSIVTSTTDFLNDLDDLLLGYDHINKRLICTKSTLDYSYMYDIKSKTWCKLSEAYDSFVQHFPNLIAVAERGMIDLSDMTTDTNNIQVHFHTKIINAESEDLKKLDESVLRCSLLNESGKFSSFGLWASNDLLNWAFVTGNDRRSRSINDIQITYAHSAFKYFVFAYWGELKPEHNNFFTTIQSEIEIVDIHKDGRIRSW